MSGRLPDTIDPITLAEQGARLAGELPLRAMARLVSGCEVGEDMASVELKFGREPHGLLYLRARLSARLRLVCQRCLQPMDLALRSEPILALLLPGESQAGVPEEAEPLVVEPDWSLAAWVEDELLLAMPMMPRHPPGECEASTVPPRKKTQVEVKTQRPNPFAVLEKLHKRD
jgi:uncharacterized protein